MDFLKSYKNSLQVLNKNNQKGATPLLILIAVIGVIAFFLLVNLVGFKDKFFGSLFPKPASHASGNVDLAFAPSQVSVTKDATFTVDINIDAKTEQVTAAEIHFSYDPQKLQPISSQVGSKMPIILPPGTSTSPVSMSNGQGVLALGTNPGSPATGTGILATITFKALQETVNTTTTLAFDTNTTEIAALNHCVDIQCDNVAGTLSPSQITISTSGGGTTVEKTARFELSNSVNPANIGQEFPIELKVVSNTDSANLFSAKLNFDSSVIEVVRIDTSENTFISEAYWAERVFDNSLGKISIAGGVPSPGFKTSGTAVTFAKIYVRGKAQGTTNLSFDPQSVIYRDSDNANILTTSFNLLINVSQEVEPTTAPTASPTSAPTSNPSENPSSSPIVDNCAVSAVNWKNTVNPVNAGDTIIIEVIGNTLCEGKHVSFEVLEDDGLLGTDKVKINPQTVVFPANGGTVTTGWIAEYQPDGLGGISDPPEYFIRATVEGVNGTVKSGDPNLEVNKPTGSVVKQGDINNDGKVDLQDLSVMLSNWNKNTDLIDEIDQNNDGVINTFDFSLMLVTLRAEGVLSAQQ